MFTTILVPRAHDPSDLRQESGAWEHPFQACAIYADCMKPDGQNSVISFVISEWLLPELSFSDRWSREDSGNEIGLPQEIDQLFWESVNIIRENKVRLPNYMKAHLLQLVYTDIERKRKKRPRPTI